MKSIVIIYHNDQDGFGGAWAAWKKFKNKASYFPMRYNISLPEGIKDKEVYFIDFYPNERDVAEKIFKENKKVVVIDHHESQIENEREFSTEFVYSNNNSGCVLAWDYFHSEKATPKLLRHVEDMDLWKFKVKFTREVIAALDTYEMNFKSWDKIVKDFEKAGAAKKYIEEGKAIIKYQNTLIKKLASRGTECTIDGQKAFAVNSPILESEIGHFINDTRKVIGIVWSYGKNEIIGVSLRSRKDTNVSKVAQKFGGGGHKQASGFRGKVEFKFPWKKVNTKKLKD